MAHLRLNGHLNILATQFNYGKSIFVNPFFKQGTNGSTFVMSELSAVIVELSPKGRFINAIVLNVVKIIELF